jgi:histidinol dehydrogenase
MNAPMRILRLTPSVERSLLAARSGRDRKAERVASHILEDVHRNGDSALFRWTRKLDRVDLHRDGLWISSRDFRAAEKRVSPDFLRALRHAARNIRRVAEQQLPKPWTLAVEPGVHIRQIVRPIDSLGCYIPGGRFALVSTLLMTVIPAQVAGVARIVAVCPKPNPELLAAAGLLGIRQIAHIGGAQAIAALAFGTKSVPRVEKICGPGNRFVTTAKQLVSRECAIDLPAGPTEAVILADSGNPAWIAADLLAQAEHAPDAGSFLVSTSLLFARRVAAEVGAQLARLDQHNPAHHSIKKTGAILIAKSREAARDFVNRFAPEHLSLPASPRTLLPQIDSAGTIFSGPYAAQPLGDYASGSNHVLPTGGWARRRAGLSAADFVKCITVQEVSRQGFARLAPTAEAFASAEGLAAHRNATTVRR